MLFWNVFFKKLLFFSFLFDCVEIYVLCWGMFVISFTKGKFTV